MGIKGFGSGSLVEGLGVVVSIACLRLSVFGDGFQPLHWNILSWFVIGFWARVLRVFRRGWVVWCINGGRILGVSRVGIVGLLGERSVGVMVGLC